MQKYVCMFLCASACMLEQGHANKILYSSENQIFPVQKLTKLYA